MTSRHGRLPAPGRCDALEMALINRRVGHEEFVCAGWGENVLLASSPDYLTNWCVSTREGQRLLDGRRSDDKETPGLEFYCHVYHEVRGPTVTLDVGPCVVMETQLYV